MNQGYFITRHKDVMFLKLKGTLHYTTSAPFRTLIDKMKLEEQLKIMVDMTETEYIDSTNLGLLAKLANLVRKANSKMTLVSTNTNITDLLVNVGFDNLCLIVDEPDKCTRDYCEVKYSGEGDRDLALIMLDSHRELVHMNVKNKMLFQDVIEYLERYE